MLRPLIFTAAVTAGLTLAAGAYAYRVVQYDYGAWYAYSDTSCQVGAGCIDMDAISSPGATGYLNIPAAATYVKLTNLALTPAK